MEGGVYKEIGIRQKWLILRDTESGRIGKGSFADVYKCWKKKENGDPSEKTYVAKRIFYKASIPDMSERIEKEIKAMKKVLDITEYAVKIYDSFPLPDGGCYIIMDYCEGGDLESYAEKYGPFSEETVAILLKPLVTAFVALHENNIMHRDLKLANILLVKPPTSTDKPQPRITDFGLASVLPEDDEIRRTICGTPMHMSPEVWKGSGYKFPADVWAFGVLFYKLIFGVYFPSCKKQDVVKEEANTGFLKIPRARIVSLECIDLILKCFRTNPEKRITFKEMSTHSFFTRKPDSYTPFHMVTDGLIGYREISNKGNPDFLVGIATVPKYPQGETDPILDAHNLDVLKKLSNPPV